MSRSFPTKDRSCQRPGWSSARRHLVEQLAEAQREPVTTEVRSELDTPEVRRADRNAGHVAHLARDLAQGVPLLGRYRRHRAARSFEQRAVDLVLDPAPHLRLADALAPAEADHLPERVVDLLSLSAAGGPVTRAALREKLKVRNATLGDVLSQLELEGASGVMMAATEALLRAQAPLRPFPFPPLARRRNGTGPA